MVERGRLGLDKSAIQRALLAACGNGQAEVVEEVLKWTDGEGVPLREALREAASHGHSAVMQVLLNDSDAAGSATDFIEDALKSSFTCTPPVFQDILDLVEKKVSKQDVARSLAVCLVPASEAGRADILRTIFDWDPDLVQERLLDAFHKACKAGKTAAVSVIYESLQPGAVTQKKMSTCIRRAVEEGNLDLAQYLLPISKEHGSTRYLPNMLLASAGNGFTSILEWLLVYYDAAMFDKGQLLQRALNVAAANGHHEACAYLISQGIDPCNPAPKVRWHDVSVDRGRYAAYGSESDSSETEDVLSTSDDYLPGHSDAQSVNRSCSAEHKGVDSMSGSNGSGSEVVQSASHERFKTEKVKPNAVESCVLGYERFEQDDNFFAARVGRTSWKQRDEDAQTTTMRLLLQSVSSLHGPKWSHANSLAAKNCPLELVTLMLDKGADASAGPKTGSALDAAVTRECLSFTVLQALIQAGADQDLTEDDLRRLLNKTLVFFHAHDGKADDQGALLTKTATLQDAFITGPGGIVQYLLRRLPYERAQSSSYDVLLQLAAAAGQITCVALLIERDVKPNATGSYYGTALQAACRFGHADVVRLLLDAGSDPDIIQGRHHTALRAAALGGHLEVVEMLLASGADTELSAVYHSYRGDEEPDPTALQLALTKKHTDVASILISAGAKVEPRQKVQKSLLIQACALGYTPLIQLILAAGANVQVFAGGESAMHAAVDQGRLDIIELLLANSFDLTAKFPDYEHPLTLAARIGDLAVMDVLLRDMPAISAEVLSQTMSTIVSNSRFAAVSNLLGHGAIIFDPGRGANVLKSACAKDDSTMLELVLERLAQCGQAESACAEVLPHTSVASANIFETLLDYVPCTADVFVEACIHNYANAVRSALEQGVSPRTEDNKGRPALHIAAVPASDTVVELLLDNGADPGMAHSSYGPPLRAALEGCVVNNLLNGPLEEDLRTYALSLTGERGDFNNTYRYRSRRKPVSSSFPKTRRYEKIVRLLLADGAQAETPAGHFGSALTLASFAGIYVIFDMLIEHGANVGAIGGSLYSPLSAAVEGNHLKLARRILEMSSDVSAGACLRGHALHAACEKGNLPAVKMLLTHEADPVAKNGSGNTPLGIVLAKLATVDPWDPEPSDQETIVNLILDADTMSKASDQALTIAAGIKIIDVRQRILKKLLARLESPLFPEDAFISLLQRPEYPSRAEQSITEQLLNEKRILRVTTRMLAAAEGVRTIERLLDYDPAYRITADTLDAVGGGGIRHVQECMRTLLVRDSSVIPTEANILTVLRHGSSRSLRVTGETNEEPHLLEVMFSRNPELRVTEDMLNAVESPGDLVILLTYTKPEESLVTTTVLSKLAAKYGGSVGKLLWTFLDFDRFAVVPPETVRRVLFLENLGTYERLINHDLNFYLSEENLLTVFGNVHREDRRREDAHQDFVNLLRKHRGQWEFSRKVRAAIDLRFLTRSDQGLRDLYYSLAEDADGKSLKVPDISKGDQDDDERAVA